MEYCGLQRISRVQLTFWKAPHPAAVLSRVHHHLAHRDAWAEERHRQPRAVDIDLAHAEVPARRVGIGVNVMVASDAIDALGSRKVVPIKQKGGLHGGSSWHELDKRRRRR